MGPDRDSYPLMHKTNALLPRFQVLINSYGGHVITTMSTNIILAVFSLATGTMLARTLGSQGRGELAIIQTWGAFIALVATLGLPDAIVYFTSREPGKGGSYFSTTVILSLISSTFFAVLAFFTLPFFLAAQSIEIITLARWYVVGFIFLMATQGMLVHPLRGRNDFISWNFLRISYIAIWFGILFTIIILGFRTTTFIAGGYLLSLVVSGILGYIFLRSRISGSYPIQPKLWLPMLSFGLPTALTAFPQMLNLRLDQLLMTTLFSSRLIGYYAVAVAWGSAVTPFLQSIGSVLFPKVASQKNIEQQLNILGRSIRVGVIMMVSVVLLILLITPFCVPFIFGSEFSPAIPSAIVLVIAGGLTSLNVILGEGLRGLGIPKAAFWSEVVGLVGTIIGLAVLLPTLQILGAALASLCGYAIVSISLFIWLARYTGESVPFFVVPRWNDFQVIAQWVKTIKLGGNF